MDLFNIICLQIRKARFQGYVLLFSDAVDETDHFIVVSRPLSIVII